MPALSIGMPVYNGARYLRGTLQALLCQTFRDFELIVSDNASRDATPEICREFAAKDRRVRFIAQDRNRGAAWNYNFVAREATGRYFKWAAADDLCAPEYLEHCIDMLNRHEDVIICYPKTTIIDENGKPRRDYDDQLHLLSSQPVDRFRALQQLIGECNAVFGVIRHDVLSRTALIGNYIASDVNLLAELSLYGKFYQVPERLFFRRDHSEASSADKSVQSQMNFFDPARRDKSVFPLSRSTLEYWRAVWRAPLQLTGKVRLTVEILWAAIQSRHKLWAEWCQGGRQALARFQFVKSTTGKEGTR